MNAGPIPARGFFRRLLTVRGILFLLAAAITFCALLLAEENWRGARAWEKFKREQEAKGESFDPARLIPPKVPDAENFAMTPYFAPVFRLTPEVLRHPIAVNANGLVPENHLGTNIASRLPDPAKAPHRAGWLIGTANDLIPWADAFLATNSTRRHTEITNAVEAASIILEGMQPYDATLAELQLASQRPYCRFNIPYEQWDNPHVLSSEMEHFKLIKGLDRMLVLRSEAELVSGKSDLALKDINVMFRMDDGLKDEPLLMSQLVRMAAVSIILQSVGEGLAEHRWSDAQLQFLQERLQKTDIIAANVRALYGERDIIGNPALGRGNFSAVGGNRMPRGWLFLEQISINRAQDMVLSRIDLPAREINPAVNRSIDEAVNKFVNGGVFRSVFIDHTIFAKMLVPAFGKVARQTAYAQSEVDMAMLSCALERYRLAHGQYPEQLDALAPQFVAVLPRDIINGQPLKYQRTPGDRFILYSVGWNEKDDDGVIALDKANQPDVLQGDWVWRYPETN